MEYYQALHIHRRDDAVQRLFTRASDPQEPGVGTSSMVLSAIGDYRSVLASGEDGGTGPHISSSSQRMIVLAMKVHTPTK